MMSFIVFSTSSSLSLGTNPPSNPRDLGGASKRTAHRCGARRRTTLGSALSNRYMFLLIPPAVVSFHSEHPPCFAITASRCHSLRKGLSLKSTGLHPRLPARSPFVLPFALTRLYYFRLVTLELDDACRWSYEYPTSHETIYTQYWTSGVTPLVDATPLRPRIP